MEDLELETEKIYIQLQCPLVRNDALLRDRLFKQLGKLEEEEAQMISQRLKANRHLDFEQYQETVRQAKELLKKYGHNL